MGPDPATSYFNDLYIATCITNSEPCDHKVQRRQILSHIGRTDRLQCRRRVLRVSLRRFRHSPRSSRHMVLTLFSAYLSRALPTPFFWCVRTVPMTCRWYKPSFTPGPCDLSTSSSYSFRNYKP